MSDEWNAHLQDLEQRNGALVTYTLYSYKTAYLLKKFTNSVKKAMLANDAIENAVDLGLPPVEVLKWYLKKDKIEDPALRKPDILPKPTLAQNPITCPNCKFVFTLGSVHSCVPQNISPKLEPEVERVFELIKRGDDIKICSVCLDIFQERGADGNMHHSNDHSKGFCPVQKRGPTKQDQSKLTTIRRLFRTLNPKDEVKPPTPVAAIPKKQAILPALPYVTAKVPILPAVPSNVVPILPANHSFLALLRSSTKATGTKTIVKSRSKTKVKPQMKKAKTDKVAISKMDNDNRPAAYTSAIDGELGKGINEYGVPPKLRCQYVSMIDVKGDGHCGFRAIALAMNLQSDHYKYSYGGLRLSAIEHLNKYKDDFFAVFEKIDNTLDLDTIVEQLNVFESPVVNHEGWFNLETHGTIIADLLSTPICITQGQDFDQAITLLPIKHFNPKNDPIFIHFFRPLYDDEDRKAEKDPKRREAMSDGHYVVGIVAENYKLLQPMYEWVCDSDAVRQAKKFFSGKFSDELKLNSQQSKDDGSGEVDLTYDINAFNPELGRGQIEVLPGLENLYDAMYDIPGDGNCGFRAVAFALNLKSGRNEFSYGSLRIAAYQHLLLNRDFFENESNYRDGTSKEGKAMVDKVSSQLRHFQSPAPMEHWFGTLRHGTVLADVLGVPICVTEIQNGSLKASQTCFPLHKFDPAKEPIYIHRSGTHFLVGVVNYSKGPIPDIITRLQSPVFAQYLVSFHERIEKFVAMFDMTRNIGRKDANRANPVGDGVDTVRLEVDEE